MATVCPKCGTSLSSEAGFCPSCGAPIGGETAASSREFASPPPVQAAPPPPAYGQPATAYPAVAPKKSGGALKIVLIVIAVVFGLGILAVGILGYVGYRAMHAAGNSMAIGSSAEVSEADLGVSLYPGAVRNTNGTMRMKLANLLTVSATYTTSDPASSVVSYYQDKLGPNAIASQRGEVTTLTSATASGTLRNNVVVTITPRGNSGTQLMIVHSQTQ
jgi:zinc-ribbon domain